MIAGVSAAVGGAVLVLLGALRWRHKTATKKRATARSHPRTSRGFENQPGPQQPPDDRSSHSSFFAGGSEGLSAQGTAGGQSAHVNTLAVAEGSRGGATGSRSTSAAGDPTLSLPVTSSAALSGTSAADEPPLPRPVGSSTAKLVKISQGQSTASGEDGNDDRSRGGGEKEMVQESLTATTSTATMSTVERAEADQFYQRQSMVDTALVEESTSGGVSDSWASSCARPQGAPDGIGLGDAVMAAAVDLAKHCHIPGVSEAAAALSILVKMVSDSRDSGSDAKLRQCRSIVRVLERAGEVAEKGGGTTEQAGGVLIEDVHFAISDLVELLKTYESKNKLSKLLTSTQFKRRQSELDAAVNQAITRLQLGLQVQIGQDVSAVKHGINVYQASADEAKAKSLAEARRSRRQRKLDAVEIPADQVEVSDELLGRGGFGEVFIARVYERNAAAK
ncbi:unnamed protein product, partial [Scytosiphon promiscuus]